ncbi:hypothetical protein ACJMK2_022713 [Sinanodonta woodiana]|uniref:WSC domain-containing protein n=1 Tax=Sinanodonta woodiana TaxID=1069815 RepID=A0ABD3TJW3_SINWO
MAFMGFVAAIYFRIFWTCIPANGEIVIMNITLTWNESLNYCQRIGKLLMDVKDDTYKSLLQNRLNEGNQTWVSARIELSEFIKTPVCMAASSLKSNVSSTFVSNTISNCLKLCSDHRYIGLKETECVCIQETKSLTPSKACNSTCNNDEIRLCGGNQSFSVYERVDTSITQEIATGYKECVYAQQHHKTTKLFTASCVGNTSTGGLCESGNTSECTKNSWTSIGKNQCQMDLPIASRWSQAKMFCAGIGGELMSPSELPLSLGENRTYWLGIHRVTTIHDDKENSLKKNYTYCSVARKEGDKKVLIEAENCEAKHTFICQDFQESVTSFSTHSNETHEKGSDTDHDGGTIIYLSISVSAIVLVAIVITILACVFRRRHYGHKTVSVDSSSSEHQVLQSTNPPAKPLRKMYSKKDDVNTSYENIVHICSDENIEMQQTGISSSVPADYDKIDFGKEHNGLNLHGQHMYDHTTLCTTEDQYDLTDLSGDTDLKHDGTYHKITLAQTLEMTKSVAGEDIKVSFETNTQDDNDLYDKMGQN